MSRINYISNKQNEPDTCVEYNRKQFNQNSTGSHDDDDSSSTVLEGKRAKNLRHRKTLLLALWEIMWQNRLLQVVS